MLEARPRAAFRFLAFVLSSVPTLGEISTTLRTNERSELARSVCSRFVRVLDAVLFVTCASRFVPAVDVVTDCRVS